MKKLAIVVAILLAVYVSVKVVASAIGTIGILLPVALVALAVVFSYRFAKKKFKESTTTKTE